MADNYLEKKMDDYRSGRKAPRPSSPRLKHRVLIMLDDAGLTCSIVRQRRAEGCMVAFCMTDTRLGTRLAQECGARFYPFACSEETLARMTADARARWDGFDEIIR